MSRTPCLGAETVSSPAASQRHERSGRLRRPGPAQRLRVLLVDDQDLFRLAVAGHDHVGKLFSAGLLDGGVLVLLGSLLSTGRREGSHRLVLGLRVLPCAGQSQRRRPGKRRLSDRRGLQTTRSSSLKSAAHRCAPLAVEEGQEGNGARAGETGPPVSHEVRTRGGRSRFMPIRRLWRAGGGREPAVVCRPGARPPRRCAPGPWPGVGRSGRAHVVEYVRPDLPVRWPRAAGVTPLASCLLKTLRETLLVCPCFVAIRSATLATMVRVHGGDHTFTHRPAAGLRRRRTLG